jgi:hypothetical protein
MFLKHNKRLFEPIATKGVKEFAPEVLDDNSLPDHEVILSHWIDRMILSNEVHQSTVGESFVVLHKILVIIVIIVIIVRNV